MMADGLFRIFSFRLLGGNSPKSPCEDFNDLKLSLKQKSTYTLKSPLLIFQQKAWLQWPNQNQMTGQRSKLASSEMAPKPPELGEFFG